MAKFLKFWRRRRCRVVGSECRMQATGCKIQSIVFSHRSPLQRPSNHFRKLIDTERSRLQPIRPTRTFGTVPT